MKKIVFSIFCCSIALAGCQSKTLENNLSQIRIAKAAELEEGKTKAERAKEIKQNILKINEIQEVAVIIEGKTALIGLRLKENSQKDVVNLKAEADILAKEADKNIDSTAITANENITAMIEKMEKERSLLSWKKETKNFCAKLCFTDRIGIWVFIINKTTTKSR